MNQPYKHVSPKAARARKERARKKRIASLVILCAAVLVVGSVAFILVEVVNGGQQTASSAAVSVAAPAPSSQALPVAVSSAPQEEVRIPPAEGPYDLAGIPPLYNRFNPIPADVADNVESSLVTIAGSAHRMEAGAAEAYMAMQRAAQADGIALTPVSGYRTNQHQYSNYWNKLDLYLGQGYSQVEARERTELYHAIPGTSEHEAGLAMDINMVDDAFANTPAFAWLQENAATYGFIFRYKAETVDVTRIAYEPWHYRFIGANHAAKMDEMGFETLEDYIAYLKDVPRASLEVNEMTAER